MLGEWVIDILQEWVGDQGFLTDGFVDRGDPAARDFELVDFTVDGAWYDLDLSGIVPSGASAVCIAFEIANTAAAKAATFRAKGNVNSFNVSEVNTQGGFLNISQDLTVPLDSNRFIQYKFDFGGWLAIRFTVKGWWF